MNKLFKIAKELPWWIRNVYFVIGLLFFIWMIFFDRNNSFATYRINKSLSQLEDQKEYYESEIHKVNALKEELFSTDAKKEKFAREKYLMKKSNEDIFVITKVKE